MFSSGCSAPAVDAVPLLTGVPPTLRGGDGGIACFTNWEEGLLVVDPKYARRPMGELRSRGDRGSRRGGLGRRLRSSPLMGTR
jgi:hypothetical protein